MGRKAIIFFSLAILFFFLLIAQVLLIAWIPDTYLEVLQTIPAKSLMITIATVLSFALCFVLYWMFYIPTAGKAILGWMKICAFTLLGSAASPLGLFAVEKVSLYLNGTRYLEISIASTVGPSVSFAIAALILGFLFTALYVKHRQWEQAQGLAYKSDY
ncbi:MAG: hypothetical protein JKY92_03130 [Magnetovibrio sp.]|nr:hypothetical protein [Magnetovibrio sp.]